MHLEWHLVRCVDGHLGLAHSTLHGAIGAGQKRPLRLGQVSLGGASPEHSCSECMIKNVPICAFDFFSGSVDGHFVFLSVFRDNR